MPSEQSLANSWIGWFGLLVVAVNGEYRAKISVIWLMIGFKRGFRKFSKFGIHKQIIPLKKNFNMSTRLSVDTGKSFPSVISSQNFQ